MLRGSSRKGPDPTLAIETGLNREPRSKILNCSTTIHPGVWSGRNCPGPTGLLCCNGLLNSLNRWSVKLGEDHRRHFEAQASVPHSPAAFESLVWGFVWHVDVNA